LKHIRDLQYKQLARYYDMVRIPDRYDQEVRILKRIITKLKASRGRALLDAGCGTGGHLRYLVNDFDCTGLDLHEGMLRLARKDVPKATFIRADMTNFHIGNKFDVILCVYSAIGLVRTYRNLERTVKNFANHLKSGGIVILENDSFSYPRSPSLHMKLLTTERGYTKIAKVEYYQRKGNVLVEREDYLVAERGKGVKHYADLQLLGMFELKRTKRILERAGLEPRFLKGALHRGRGLLLGIKPTTKPVSPRIKL
jgi:SAM-dependent methyltransferase